MFFSNLKLTSLHLLTSVTQSPYWCLHKTVSFCTLRVSSTHKLCDLSDSMPMPNGVSFGDNLNVKFHIYTCIHVWKYRFDSSRTHSHIHSYSHTRNTESVLVINGLHMLDWNYEKNTHKNRCKYIDEHNKLNEIKLFLFALSESFIT